MLLIELFDKPVKWKWDSFEKTVAYFDVNDKTYKVTFHHTKDESIGTGLKKRSTDKAYEFGFALKRGDEYVDTITDTGDSIAVFSTIIDIIKSFISAKKPEKLLFSAKESNRQSLYKILIKKLAKDWHVAEKTHDNMKVFVLTDKELQQKLSNFDLSHLA